MRIASFPSRLPYALLALVAVSCGKGSEVTTPATTYLVVQSVSPASGVQDAPATGSVVITFSEALDRATVTGSTCFLSPATPCSLSVSGSRVEILPSQGLRTGTLYAVNVTTGVRSAAGRSLQANYGSNFKTAGPPPPALDVPFVAGQWWQYEQNSTWAFLSIYGSTSGKDEHDPVYVFHDGDTYYQGRSCTRLRSYHVGGRMEIKDLYVASSPTALEIWDAFHGRWGKAYAQGVSAVSVSAFLMTVGHFTEAGEISSAQVTVPAGTYNASRMRANVSRTGQYETEKVTETRTEYWVPGVGLARTDWAYFYNPQDPNATDATENGSVVLVRAGSGPPPLQRVSDEEPNDLAHVQGLFRPAFVSGTLAPTDTSGTSGSDARARLLGTRRAQLGGDWYLLNMPAGSSGTYRVGLKLRSLTAAPADAANNAALWAGFIVAAGYQDCDTCEVHMDPVGGSSTGTDPVYLRWSPYPGKLTIVYVGVWGNGARSIGYDLWIE